MNSYSYEKKRRFIETLIFRKSQPIIDSLSNMLCVSITLFDAKGNFVYQSSWKNEYCEETKKLSLGSSEDDSDCSRHYKKIIDYVKNYQMPYIQECPRELFTIAYPLIIQDINQEVFSDVLLGILFFSPMILSDKLNSNEENFLAFEIKENNNLRYSQFTEPFGTVKSMSSTEISQIKDLTYAIFGEMIGSSWEIAQIVDNSVALQNELTLLYDFVKKSGGKAKQADILKSVKDILEANIRPLKLLILLDEDYMKEFAPEDNANHGSGNEQFMVVPITNVSGSNFFDEAIKHGRTFIKNGTVTESIECLVGLSAQKVMVCPIKFDEEILGLMVFLDKRDSEDFFADDAKFAEALASSVGIVLEIFHLTSKLAESEVWKEISFRAAHKIGNVLFALKGPIARIKSLQDSGKLTNDRIDDLIQRLDERMQETDSIIRSIKDYVRPNELRLSKEDINSILSKIAQDIEPTIGKSISLKLNLDKDLPELMLDSERISRAIEEIIQNASHFIRDGGEIFLRTGMASSDERKRFSLSENQQLIAIEIIDSGIGIMDVDKEKIFYPFYSTRAAGTGQGLAIVATDIKLHGGFIREIGKYGEGADFLILLPIYKKGGS